MIDPHTRVLAFWQADTAIVAVTTTDRIYAGRAVPPEGYKPDDGPCICFMVRDGAPDYPDALLNPSIQVKCYAETEAEAYELYRLVYDATHNGHGAGVLHAESETLGVVLEEPETGWIFVLAHFIFMLRQ